MADTTILVPGRDSVSIVVGETLTIDFVESCNFCCNPEEVDAFLPQLPLGDHLFGDTWSGIAQQSGTFQFHHVKYGGHCRPPAAPADSGRVIIVGDGG
jgi:hypothetical protein